MPAMERPHKLRSAAAAMLGIFLFKIGASAYGPAFAELLLQRACAALAQPLEYPSPACENSAGAAAVAAQHTSAINLATSIPQLLTVSLLSVLADSYGRKLTLFICALGGLLQCLLVWLLPATTLFGVGWVEALTAASCVVSFSGGWSVALATSFAVCPARRKNHTLPRYCALTRQCSVTRVAARRWWLTSRREKVLRSVG
jgi:MFS family permease